MTCVISSGTGADIIFANNVDLNGKLIKGIADAVAVNGAVSKSQLDGLFGSKSTSSLLEGSNLYHTAARVDALFDSRLALKSTSNLLEGSNLYHTAVRVDALFDSRLALKSTSNLLEGSNLYHTPSRVDALFDSRLALKNSDNLVEGVSNRYYTVSRDGLKLDKSGGTMSGNLLMGNFDITGIKSLSASMNSSTLGSALAPDNQNTLYIGESSAVKLDGSAESSVNQYSISVLNARTINATSALMLLKNGAHMKLKTALNNQAWNFDIQVIGINTSSAVAVNFRGLISKIGVGAISLDSGFLKEKMPSASAYDASLSVDSTDNSLRVSVVGDALLTMNWSATMRITSVR